MRGLIASFREEHEPATPTEEICVYKMAEHFWAAKRASYLLAKLLDALDRDGEQAQREVFLMMRYHSTSDRALNRLFFRYTAAVFAIFCLSADSDSTLLNIPIIQLAPPIPVLRAGS